MPLRISLAGHVADIGAHPAKDDHRIRRLLFDLSDDAALPNGIHAGLDKVARALNLYALAGIPDRQVEVVVLLHGKATSLALRPEAFTLRTGHANANAHLLEALLDTGVRIEVCGQAIHRHGYGLDEVNRRIPVQLSALQRRESLLSSGFVSVD